MSDRASTASGEAGRSSCRHARCDAGGDFGDGDVYRACAAAAKSVMWNIEREAG
jgi:hypothetical protein